MPRTFRSNQKGQALPLGIAFLASSVLFAIVLFNTGQTASEKSRLTNTADAAAYSGLIWQARALNFQAYTNRAMVANQVSIGQMVSLTSWTQYAYILARNIDTVIGWIPVVRPFTTAAERVTETIDDVMVTITETFIPIVDGVNGVLSQTQRAIYLASFAATPAIVSEVVEKNDQRYSATSAYAVIGMGENALGWRNFSNRYDDRDSLMRKKDVIDRSKDQFSNTREFRMGSFNLGLVRGWLKKEGRTNLIVEENSSSNENNWFNNNNNGNNLEWEWKGKDTFSFHIETWGCGWSGCGWRHREIPLGWGSRYVNGDFDCEETEHSWWWFGSGCTRYTNENRRAEWLADAEREELDAEYEGIRAYYDLADLSEQNKDPRLALRIQVELPQNEVRTASKIDGIGSTSVPDDLSGNGIGQGVFGTEDRMAGGGMAAIASGELYFHPPDDYMPSNRNGRYEIASLYSPYWEVRLTQTPISRRFMAWGLRDTSLITQGASGVVDGVERFVSDKAEELERLVQLQQDLQNQLENTTDEALRGELEQQLSSVTEEITQMVSIDVDTGLISSGLQQGMSQGLSYMSNASVSHYENLLQDYATQQGENLVNQFQDEIVGQVTDQMEQALENAMQDAIGNAMSSML